MPEKGKARPAAAPPAASAALGLGAEEAPAGIFQGRLGVLSSNMVGRAFIAGWLVVSVLALLGGRIALSAFLLFMGIICLLSRRWGLRALRNVTVELHAQSARVFAGGTVELSYAVRNNKFLPLIWLELAQRLPSGGCMEPLDEDEVGELPISEEEETALHLRFVKEIERRKTVGIEELPPPPPRTYRALRKRFAFILWYQSLEWVSVWKTLRRGVYPVDSLLLRSGDGFGLTQTEKVCAVPSQPTFVVYPRLVQVRVEPFLQNLWDAKSGSKGYFEDCTIIRGERAYQSTDSWKRINWRMAARREELQVKLYETILPKSIQFLFDAASFLNRSPRNEELEETISVIASLAVRLEEAQVWCGLTLPKTENAPAVCLYPGENVRSDDLLFALAGFDCGCAVSGLDGIEAARARVEAGQAYLVTYSAADRRNKDLLDQLGTYGVTILPYDEDYSAETGNAGFLDYKILPLQTLKGGAPHA